MLFAGQPDGNCLLVGESILLQMTRRARPLLIFNCLCKLHPLVLSMTIRVFLLWLNPLLVASALAGLLAQEKPPKSIWDGICTNDPAACRQALYRATCTSCPALEIGGPRTDSSPCGKRFYRELKRDDSWRPIRENASFHARRPTWPTHPGPKRRHPCHHEIQPIPSRAEGFGGQRRVVRCPF